MSEQFPEPNTPSASEIASMVFGDKSAEIVAEEKLARASEHLANALKAYDAARQNGNEKMIQHTEFYVTSILEANPQLREQFNSED